MPKNNWKGGRGLSYFLVLSGRPSSKHKTQHRCCLFICKNEFHCLRHLWKYSANERLQNIKKVEESSKKGARGTRHMLFHLLGLISLYTIKTGVTYITTHKIDTNILKSFQKSQINFFLSCWKQITFLFIIVGFFIPVSSLKVFGHSIHSERRRIYLGKSIQALQNDTIIISWVFSFRVIQPTVPWHTFKIFMFVFINSCSSQKLFEVVGY